MSIEAKKNNIISLILSVVDEDIIDDINSKIIQLVPKEDNLGDEISKYRVNINEKFDLEKIKKEQNYKSPNLIEIEKLVEEADIQEPIDELLKMI